MAASGRASSSTLRKSASGKKAGTKKSVAQAAVTLVKQRLGDMGNDVTEPTYRFLSVRFSFPPQSQPTEGSHSLQLLYHAKPTFINAIFSITQQADADKVAGYLARIFYFVDRALYLAHVVIAWEVESTSTPPFMWGSIKSSFC